MMFLFWRRSRQNKNIISSFLPLHGRRVGRGSKALTMTVFLLFALLFLILALLAWRWSRAWQAARAREQVEDALKCLLEHEQRGRHLSVEGLAGCLRVRPARAFRLVNRMSALGLVAPRGDGLHLTPEGERYALHVVRAHRLWERYLADEARLPLQAVHREAHRREHGMTPEELDRLAASLGYPRYDPHGDPIPEREGPLPAEEGHPLTDWPLDTPGVIVHLEDEPPIAYAQLLAEGLRLGQTVRVLEATPERILISNGEREIPLAPAVAANVFVARPEQPPGPPPEAIPLSALPDGQEAEVITIDPAVQGFTRRRLLDLGLTPGAKVRPELRPMFRDPRAYRVRGTLIALRNDQAEHIWVKPVRERK